VCIELNSFYVKKNSQEMIDFIHTYIYIHIYIYIVAIFKLLLVIS